MIMIDGDDFLYPYALNQLNKCFKKKSFRYTYVKIN